MSADKIKKIILENKFYFFSTFRKITVGGFVNQLIKNSGLMHSDVMDTVFYSGDGWGSMP